MQILKNVFACPPKPNGNMHAGRELTPLFLLAIESPRWMPIAITKFASLLQWEAMNPTLLGYTICMVMFSSGAGIGMVITPKGQQPIRKGLPRVQTM